MVHIYPFRAVRPAPGKAADIAAVPYDVVSADEAREIINQSPLSFLRISRADALLPDTDPYCSEVYDLSRKIFDEYQETGLFIQDEKPAIYVYHVIHDDISYTGMACCADTREYESGIIRRHELTRYDKEEDRTRHIEALNANSGPVVLLHAANGQIRQILHETVEKNEPEMVTIAANGSRHEIYTIADPAQIETLLALFMSIPALYIADGHHRCKSAVNIVERRRNAKIAVSEEAHHVLSVIFAEDEVKVHGYSRLLTDLAPLNPETFFRKLSSIAHVIPYGEIDGMLYNLPVRHSRPDDHVFHLYLNKAWYECVIPKKQGKEQQALDVSVLQEEVLIPFLGITDPRGDPRLQYLGGARPVKDLMTKVDSGEFTAAIAMQPVDVRTVFSISDAGGIMPPKSTWFEPKLLSGLLVHLLD